MDVMRLLRGLFKRGVRIGYSDGPAFNPAEQIRKNGLRDISEKKQKEAEDGVNK